MMLNRRYRFWAYFLTLLKTPIYTFSLLPGVVYDIFARSEKFAVLLQIKNYFFFLIFHQTSPSCWILKPNFWLPPFGLWGRHFFHSPWFDYWVGKRRWWLSRVFKTFFFVSFSVHRLFGTPLYFFYDTSCNAQYSSLLFLLVFYFQYWKFMRQNHTLEQKSTTITKTPTKITKHSNEKKKMFEIKTFHCHNVKKKTHIHTHAHKIKQNIVITFKQLAHFFWPLK